MWSSLLDGGLAQRARQTIDDIVQTLDSRDTSPLDWSKGLIHGYMARAGVGEIHISKTRDVVEAAKKAVRIGRFIPRLYGGTVGGAWLCAHLASLARPALEETYSHTEKAISLELQAGNGPLKYDLTSGLVGFGVYFLERLPDPAARDALSGIIGLLNRQSEVFEGFVTWHTPPVLLEHSQRIRMPHGGYNLGVAHGVPGVVGLLAEICLAGGGSGRVVTLLRGAARWISSHVAGGRLPCWVGRDLPRTRDRIAWCYCELGAGVALLNAARALDDARLEQDAVGLCVGAAMRREDAGVLDAGLCHGAAGNAHLFNRLYQATGRDEFRKAAVYWFQRTLEFCGASDASPRSINHSFLTGYGGIALSLLAACHATEPEWDRVLLCRLRPI